MSFHLETLLDNKTLLQRSVLGTRFFPFFMRNYRESTGVEICFGHSFFFFFMRNYKDSAGVIFHEDLEAYGVWVKLRSQEGFQI